MLQNVRTPIDKTTTVSYDRTHKKRVVESGVVIKDTKKKKGNANLIQCIPNSNKSYNRLFTNLLKCH